MLMFPRLECLRLSNNQLERVPAGMHREVELRELKLDRNPGITHLPSNLHLLQELFFFKFEGISDPVVSELRSCSNTPEQLLYLKAREKDYCRNTSMRLFVIGHFSKGKSTVIAALRRKRQSRTFDERTKRTLDPNCHLTEDEQQSTVGIQCEKWVYKKTETATEITFYTWDFAGQEEYYLTHQCFFTNRAVYLLVWNVADGVEGIKSLTVWLQNLQAKAPGSSVIVVGTHIDLVPRTEREEKVKLWQEMVNCYSSNRAHSHLYPHIMGVCFVGIPQRGKQTGIHGPDGLADCIYDVAMTMEVPNGPHVGGVSVKMMQEMVPVAYERLRCEIDHLQEQVWLKREPPVLSRELFWTKMSGKVALDKNGIEAAVDFLHASTGMILHFKLPHLVDHYIIDPQYWFDLCALVISPSNVSQLIRREGFISRGNGQLVARLMDQALEQQELGSSKTIGHLLRQFLMEHGVIHQVDSDNYLVPSAINPDPNLPLDAKLGHFPGQNRRDSSEIDDTENVAFSPYKTQSPKLCVVGTGLVYRRTLHLPPIASGFWSKLISLFIQQEEFLSLLSTGDSAAGYETHISTNRLRAMLGNVGIEWQYWKTGIMLIADDKLLLRVNSLQRDVFVDPRHRLVISSALSKVQNFQYRMAGLWTGISDHLSEVIEIIVPQMILEETSSAGSFPKPSTTPVQESVSAKLMAKVLELIDEILKNHCEHLAMGGIYTVNDMLQLVPCPLCYGDEDHRAPGVAARPKRVRSAQSQRQTVGAEQKELQSRPERALSKSVVVHTEERRADAEVLYTFRVDEVIQETMVSDCILCPTHGQLEIAHLAPDIAFVDLALKKLDRTRFDPPIDPHESSNLRGSFAKVVKRNFDTRSDEGTMEVAIKIFVQQDSVQPSSATELARNYADMRYELNKLSKMDHKYIVRFMGMLTNPLCFVLEWAPGMSLEHVRSDYLDTKSSLCPSALLLVLLQVTDALSYLHEKEKIIHNDLRCSNILVFQFPLANHHCLTTGAASGCAGVLTPGVLVKVADMGICANPATQRTMNKQGIRRFVPECLNYNATLTQQVDIFYLGTCLYELMSLRPLPSAELSEAEYRNMLKMGKRAGFSTQDTPYPSFLYQVLEECWQQEPYSRPPASLLHSALTELTGLVVRTDTTPAQSPHSLLLDSYILYHSSRLSTIHSVVVREEEDTQRVVMCAALSLLADNTTSIVSMELTNHQHTQEYAMETKSLWSVGSKSVCVVHTTASGLVLAALADEQIMVFNTANKTRFFVKPDQTCSKLTGRHSHIVAMHSLSSPPFLLLGFACGRLHVYTWREGGAQESLTSNEDHHCTRVPFTHTPSRLHSLLSLHTTSSDSGDSGVLSVWCGTSGSSVVVLDYPLTPTTSWGLRHDPDRLCTTIQIRGEGSSLTAKELRSSVDGRCVLALLHQPGSQTSSLAVLDTTTKTLLHLVSSDMSVSSLTLTPTQLVLGTYEGLIHLFSWSQFLSTTPHTLRASQSQTLLSHHKAVYTVSCVSSGGVTTDGLTSFTPTFVGRASDWASKEFLVSVGYGKHPVIMTSKKTAGLFRSLLLSAAVCLNVWMV